MKPRSELGVASLLLYPKGTSQATRTARSFIRYNIKMDRAGVIAKTVERLAEACVSEPLSGFFPEKCSLVPVPGHTPRRKDGLWVAEIICREMMRAGLGAEVLSCLTRATPVPHSSVLVKAEDRPTVMDHYESFIVEPTIPTSGQIVLVDDVVTRGATLFGAMLRIQEQFPSAEITAFALARSSAEELSRPADMLHPAVETIRFDTKSPDRVQRK